MDNLTNIDELIYARPKLSCNKIGVPQRDLNRNIKPEREIMLKGHIKKLRKQEKMLNKKKK